MVKGIRYFCKKLETVNGVAEYLRPAICVSYVKDGTIEANQIMEKIDVAAASFSTEKQVPGNSNTTIKVSVPFVSHSDTEEPDAGEYLEADGFIKSSVDVGAKKKWSYTRGGTTSKSMSCSDTSPNSTGNDALVKNTHGVMFSSMKVSLDSGKVPYAEFGASGIIGGKNSLSADIGFETVQAIATIDKPPKLDRTNYTVNDCVITLGTTAWEILKVSIENTNKVQQKAIMTGDGFGISQLCGLESKVSGSCYIDTAMTSLPLAKMKLGDVMALSITYGQIVGKKVTITQNVQLSSVKESYQNDLLSADFVADIIDNAQVITFNSDAVA